MMAELTAGERIVRAMNLQAQARDRLSRRLGFRVSPTGLTYGEYRIEYVARVLKDDDDPADPLAGEMVTSSVTPTVSVVWQLWNEALALEVQALVRIGAERTSSKPEPSVLRPSSDTVV